MDLWIRSQDRKRLGNIYISPKFEYIKTGKKIRNILGMEVDETISKMIGYKISNNETDLGLYKTEERALEVLDDIQQHMTYGKEIYEHDSIYSDHYHSCKCYKSDSLMIYEMPKE